MNVMMNYHKNLKIQLMKTDKFNILYIIYRNNKGAVKLQICIAPKLD